MLRLISLFDFAFSYHLCIWVGHPKIAFHRHVPLLPLRRSNGLTV